MPRSRKNTSANIQISPNLPTTVKQSDFLGNAPNKKQRISSLTDLLQAEGLQVKQAKADADSLTAFTAIQTAQNNTDNPVVVVGTDTDLLVMLMAHATSELVLYMPCSHKPKTIYRISDIKQSLGKISQNLPFLHAVSGCDTTLAMYNQGKLKALRLDQSNENLASQMNLFMQPGSTQEEIREAGETFLLSQYGARGLET